MSQAMPFSAILGLGESKGLDDRDANVNPLNPFRPRIVEPINEPEIKHLITEDDEPVNNIFSAKQQRLLIDALYNSWNGPGSGRKFLADSNVGIFYVAKNPAVVPNVFLSMDIEPHEDLRAEECRSYFTWEFGKPPDVVIEIVSNKLGDEMGDKKTRYAHMRVGYYVIFDPEHQIGDETLTLYRLEGLSYRRHESMRMPEVNLGLTLWEGEFENARDTWLRWTDEKGNIILTGKEQAMEARVERVKERVEKEAAQERADRLAAMLQRLGRDPDQV
ncbi:MAG: Uma2 family endonuclease [Blastocatellia bacterium]